MTGQQLLTLCGCGHSVCAALLTKHAICCMQVFRDGAASQIGSWISELQSESSITPLWEVMFQLMCHPVPQVN